MLVSSHHWLQAGGEEYKERELLAKARASQLVSHGHLQAAPGERCCGWAKALGVRTVLGGNSSE
jgi:hypothetical protein